MRLAFIVAALGGLALGLGLVTFRSRSDGTLLPPSPTPEVRSPEETVQAFVRAWEAGDIDSLRGLLDSASLAAYPADDLEDAYSSFLWEATARRLELAVESVDTAGATVRVRLETAYFGTLEYAIEVPLRREGLVYRVVWSERLLHPELGPGQSLRSVIQRPRRGTIFDRNGAILAETRDVRMVGLNRAAVLDRAAVEETLYGLGFSEAAVQAAFASPLEPDQRVPVGPVADDQAEEAIAAMETVPGILVYFRSQRVHPLGEAAAHVVGYTRELTADELAARAGEGYRAGDRIGATGLEAALEETLAGSIGAELRVVDASGATVKVLASRPFVPGQDVVTTLDASLQRFVYERMGGRYGAAVVMNPGTNEVLAMVSLPAFDPDAFERGDAPVLAALIADPRGPLTNRATVGTYSPGSTFKLVTGAAGLEAGVVGVGERIYCGAVWYGVDPPRRNWEGAQGWLTVAEGLMRSCNPVFYEIGLRLYQETDGALSAMARRFGFGATTGSVLAEEPGLVPDADWKERALSEPWYPGDEVNVAIGQGALLVTPLQLANAYSTFLNGVRRPPALLRDEEPAPATPLGLAEAYREQLRLGLELVTGPAGTAAATFWDQGYRDFAGKSGTAEDAEDQQHVLFVAYSPRQEPRALAAVVLDDGQSGSLEAGPIARDAVLAALAVE